jgi:ribosome-associated toxin RatA of RatAB toxin-antitoxin module
MPRQNVITEIDAPADRVWTLLIDEKEFAFWAPNVRDLSIEPADKFDVDSVRHFRLDMSGTIETLDTRITHFTKNEMFAEIPVGGSLKVHEKVEYLKMIYRVEPVDEKTTTLQFTLDYDMKGFMNKMLEKVIMGAFTASLRLWFERLKTYAETGRVV